MFQLRKLLKWSFAPLAFTAFLTTGIFTACSSDGDDGANKAPKSEESLSLTYVGTSSTTPSFTDNGTASGLSNGEYLVYPVNLLDSAVTSASIEATVTWNSANDKAGVGFVSFHDGLFADQEVNHYLIGGVAGIKGNGGSSYSATPVVETEYTVKVGYDSANENAMYTFTLKPASGTEITKTFNSTQKPWTSTDYVFLAVGGSAENVTISNVKITKNGTSLGTATAVTTMPTDNRTALSADGSVSYELTDTSSDKGDEAVVTLANISLSSLTVSPAAEGTWAWDDTTVTYDGSTNPSAKASFIPTDRATYKAILGTSVTIEVTDNREEASQTTRKFNIKYFDTSDTDLTTYELAAAGTTTGSDYVTLTPAATTYNDIYNTLTTTWVSSTGATFALTNSSNSYSTTESGATLLTVAYTITAKDYDVLLKSISFEGSQVATGNVHVDVLYGNTVITSTADAKAYSVSAQVLNKTISAGETATIYLAFTLKSGSTLNKAISPILKDIVINCSVETGYGVSISFLNGSTDLAVTYDSSTSTFTATAPDSTDSYTFAWYFDDTEVTAVDSTAKSTFTAASSQLTTGVHNMFVTATEESTGVVYSASYHVTVSE